MLRQKQLRASGVVPGRAWPKRKETADHDARMAGCLQLIEDLSLTTGPSALRNNVTVIMNQPTKFAACAAASCCRAPKTAKLQALARSIGVIGW
jgi:hypothetical protein